MQHDTTKAKAQRRFPVVDVLQQMTSPYTPQGAVFYAMIYLIAA